LLEVRARGIAHPGFYLKCACTDAVVTSHLFCQHVEISLAPLGLAELAHKHVHACTHQSVFSVG
jgi:hypothetical protein